MTVRHAVLVTHRWMGLGSSLILAAVGGTGAMQVYSTGRLRDLTGPLHESLFLGRPGTYVVLAATVAALLLDAGGLVLWWRRKVLTVETRFGWRRTLTDLHHVTGLFALVLMVILAATAVMMRFVTPESDPWLRKIIVDLHTTRDYGWALKALFCLGSLGFVVQGVSGLVMWYRPGRSAAR